MIMVYTVLNTKVEVVVADWINEGSRLKRSRHRSIYLLCGGQSTGESAGRDYSLGSSDLGDVTVLLQLLLGT